MTTASNSGQFELVFEGPENESSDTLRKLKGVFIGNLEYSIEDTQKALQNYPSTLKVADSEEELTSLFYTLRDAGARVLLVRPEGAAENGDADSEEDDDEGFEFDLEELLGSDEAEKKTEEPKEASVYELEEVDLNDPAITSLQLSDADKTDTDTPQDLSPAQSEPSLELGSLSFEAEPDLEVEASPDLGVDESANTPQAEEPSMDELSLSPEPEVGNELSLEPLDLTIDPEPLLEAIPEELHQPEVQDPEPATLEIPAPEDAGDDFDLSIDLSDTASLAEPAPKTVAEEQVHQSEDDHADDGEIAPGVLDLTPEDDELSLSPPLVEDKTDELSLSPPEPETLEPVAELDLSEPEQPAMSELSVSDDSQETDEASANESVETATAAPLKSKTLEIPDSPLDLSFDDESSEETETARPEPVQSQKGPEPPAPTGLSLGDDEEPPLQDQVEAPAPEATEAVAASGLTVDEEPIEEQMAPVPEEIIEKVAATESLEAETKTSPEGSKEAEKKVATVAPVGKVAKANAETDADIDLDQEEEDEFSEELLAAAAEWKTKKKGGLPLDVIAASVVGVVLLVVYNLYIAPSNEPPAPVLEPEVVQAALSNNSTAKKAPKKKKKEKKVVLAPLVNTSGSNDLEYATAEWTLGLREGVPAAASFVFTTPQPPEATPEMIVNDQAPEPWMTRIEVRNVELQKGEDQRFSGKSTAKVYVEYRDEKTRVIGDVEVFADKVTDSMYSLEIYLTHGDIARPDFVGGVTVRPEDNESGQMGLSLLAMLQVTAAAEEPAPEAKKEKAPKENEGTTADTQSGE